MKYILAIVTLTPIGAFSACLDFDDPSHACRHTQAGDQWCESKFGDNRKYSYLDNCLKNLGKEQKQASEVIISKKNTLICRRIEDLIPTTLKINTIINKYKFRLKNFESESKLMRKGDLVLTPDAEKNMKIATLNEFKNCTLREAGNEKFIKLGTSSLNNISLYMVDGHGVSGYSFNSSFKDYGIAKEYMVKYPADIFHEVNVSINYPPFSDEEELEFETKFDRSPSLHDYKKGAKRKISFKVSSLLLNASRRFGLSASETLSKLSVGDLVQCDNFDIKEVLYEIPYDYDRKKIENIASLDDFCLIKINNKEKYSSIHLALGHNSYSNDQADIYIGVKKSKIVPLNDSKDSTFLNVIKDYYYNFEDVEEKVFKSGNLKYTTIHHLIKNAISNGSYISIKESLVDFNNKVIDDFKDREFFYDKDLSNQVNKDLLLMFNKNKDKAINGEYYM